MNAPARLDSTPRLEDFPYRLTDNVRFADLDPNQHVNNAVYATYFETGRVTLMKDRSYGLMPDGRHLDHGAARHAFPRRTALAGHHRDGARGGEIRPHLGDVRSGGVFRRHLRRLGAIGIGAAGRGDAQADAADRGDPARNSSPGCTAASTENDAHRAGGTDGPRHGGARRRGGSIPSRGSADSDGGRRSPRAGSHADTALRHADAIRWP